MVRPKSIDKLGCNTCDPMLERRFEGSGLPEEQRGQIRAETKSYFVGPSGRLACGAESCKLPDFIVEEVPQMIVEAEDVLEAEVAVEISRERPIREVHRGRDV